jgi:hypothetical protein
MPSCFQLRVKGEKQPSTFVSIDDRICEMFGVTPDPKSYFAGWYDSIGLRLAIGRSFTEIIEEFAKVDADWARQHHKIAVWLNEHYTSDAWYEFK